MRQGMARHVSCTERMWRAALPLLCWYALTQVADAQDVSTFAGNAQHTAIYQPAARDLNRILWSTSIDVNNTGAFAHYGAPLITSSNAVVVPVKTGSGFQINVFNGSDGTAKYSLATDYILPSYTWIPVYQPVLTGGSAGARLRERARHRAPLRSSIRVELWRPLRWTLP